MTFRLLPDFVLLALLVIGSYLSAQTLPPQVERLKASYEQAREASALAPFRKAITDLNQKYGNALIKAKDTAARAGDLAAVTAFQSEIDALASDTQPTQADQAQSPALRQLRSTYIQQRQRLEDARFQAISPLAKAYIASLDREISSRGTSPDFIAIKAIRDEAISSLREVPDASTALSQREAQQRLLTWCKDNSVRVHYTEGNREKEFIKLDELPKTIVGITYLENHNWAARATYPPPQQRCPWELLPIAAPKLTHLSLRTTEPLTKMDMVAINELHNLRGLYLHAPETDPVVFDALNPLPKLHDFGGSGWSMTDSVAVRKCLAKASAVDFLHLAAFNFDAPLAAAVSKVQNAIYLEIRPTDDPAVWDALALAPSLQQLQVFNSRFEPSDVGKLKWLQGINLWTAPKPGTLTALSTLPKLQKIYIQHAQTISSDDMDKLLQCKSLTLKDVSTDQAAAVFAIISQLKGLRQLGVHGPGVDDASLMKITTLKKLEELSADGPNLGDGVLMRLSKDLPKLKIQTRRS